MNRRLAVRGAVVTGTVGAAELMLGLALGFGSYPDSTRFLLTATATVVCVAAGYFAFLGPGKAVAAVSTAARAIARGELGRRVTESGGPVAALTYDFNAMAARLQRAFQESDTERARVNAVLAATADGMIAIGPDTSIRYLNPAAAVLLRVDPTTAVGRPFIESARDYELDMLVRLAIEPPRTPQSQVIAFGPERVQLRGVAVPIEGGGEWSVLLVLSDLSDVVRVDQVRRDFVANVSHELRTPLAAVKAVVETIEAEPDAPLEVRSEFLTRLTQQVDRMTALVNELLDLSRIESGAVELHPEQLDLHDVVEEAVSLLRHELDAANMSVDLPEQNHVVVEADHTALLRVCANLLDNAAKYGGPGTTVHVDIRDDGELVALVVRDEGPGISQPELTRVFERFFKAEQGRNSRGAGLGLAIVKHIVRAHGGTAEAESPQGGGAVFTVKLPRKFVGQRAESAAPIRGSRLAR